MEPSPVINLNSCKSIDSLGHNPFHGNFFRPQMAFVAERNELLELERKKWEERMQNRRDKEVEYLKNREKRVGDYEDQLQHLRVQDAEEYNTVKIRLETDVQVYDCTRFFLLDNWLFFNLCLDYCYVWFGFSGCWFSMVV